MRIFDFLSRLLNPRADLSRLRREDSREGSEAGESEAVTLERVERPVRLRHILLNFPLMVGGLIVLVLFVAVLFGSQLAPDNPYLTGRHVVEYVDGTFRSPPFPPSQDYPLGTDELGRDTLSMLLYGARNTIVAAAFITMARLGLGLVLGGVAGWNEDKFIDQVVMGAIQMLASLPMLLVAVILILALDVRRGLPVFIAALCTIGWGEIAQYVRAEFIRIKQEPFLDSARVVGLTPLEMAIRHVLPNVLPTLIVITLLEMGAVLMILGELGFVGVYISGGIDVQVSDFVSVRFPSVPEWGAMMAQSRRWARSRPWMILPPAVAFFVSVTGFNLLGEGLRRLIDRGIFNTALLLSWRVLVVAALITAASVYVILTLGPAPSYRQLAQRVDAEGVMDHIETLAALEMEGRAPGSQEARRAADYVKQELSDYDLTTFLREVPVTLARPVEPPELALVDQEGQKLASFTRREDFGESVERHGGSGVAEAPITVVLFPSEGVRGASSMQELYARFRGLDLRGRIVMVLAGNAPSSFDTEALIRGAEGVLVVSAADVSPRNEILSDEDTELPELPVFRITPETAGAILSGDDLDYDALQDLAAELDESDRDWMARDLEARVRMRVDLSEPETVTLYNVLGLLEGADSALADEMVLISCHYDGLGRAPDGTLYPGANGNASGVAVLLEIARIWQQQGFQPRRTVVFAAWGGGNLRYSGAHGFRDRPGILGSFDFSAVVHLDRLGTPTGDALAVRRLGGGDELFDRLVSSADRFGVGIYEGAGVRYPYQSVFRDEYVGQNGTVLITWGDPQPALADDTVDNISLEHLTQAAEVINLTLITAAHEPAY